MQQDPNAHNISLPTAPATLVSSSTVVGYSYDAQNYVLDVWYKGKSKPVYRYYLCYPGMVSQAFDTGGSVGSKLRNVVRGLRYIKLA